MQPRWLKYNPITKRHAAGTRAMRWKCCLRGSSRMSKIRSAFWDSLPGELGLPGRCWAQVLQQFLLPKSGAVPDESRSWIWNVFPVSQVLNVSLIFFLAFLFPGHMLYFFSLSSATWKTFPLSLYYFFSQIYQMTSLKMERWPLRSGLFLSLLATCHTKTAWPLPTPQSPLLLMSAPALTSLWPPPSTELSSPPRAQAGTVAAVTPAGTLSPSRRTCRPGERGRWLRTRPPQGQFLKFARKPLTLGVIMSL